MAITKVQSTNSDSSSAASLAYGSNNTAGNLLICIVTGFNGNRTISSTVPTDTRGNTWHLAINPNSGGVGAAIFYAMNCAGGANTVTPANSGSAVAYEIAEFSGCAKTNALDQTASAQSGTFPATFTTTADGDLIIGEQCGFDSSAGGCTTPPTITPTGSFTADINPYGTYNTPYPHSIAETSAYQVQGTAGSFSMTKWTCSGACSGPTIQGGTIAAFFAAAAASYPDPGGMMMGGMG